MKRLTRPDLCGAMLMATLLSVWGVARAENLVLNSSFENSGTLAANWTQVSGSPGTLVRDTDNPHTGSYDLHAILGAAMDAGVNSDVFSVTEGSSYTLSFYAKGNSAGNAAFPASVYAYGPSAAMDVNIWWLDSLGNTIAGDVGRLQVATVADAATGQSSSYSKLSYSIVVPTSYNITNARIFLHFVTGAVTGGAADISIDDLSFDNGSIAPPVTGSWNTTSSGDWNTATNWSGGAIPNSSAAVATLGSAITSKQTVYTNNAVTVAGLIFNNSKTYVVGGAGSLTIDNSQANGVAGAGVVSVAAGSHKISVPLSIATNTEFNIAATSSLTVANSLSVTGGVTLSKTGDGTMRIQGAQSYGSGATLNVNAGSVIFDVNVGKNLTINNSGGSVSLSAAANQEYAAINVMAGSVALASSTATAVTTDSLAVSGTGSVDLSNSKLIVKNGTASAISDAVAAGQVMSSQSSGNRMVGYLTGAQYLAAGGSTFGGVSVNATDVLVGYALAGDTDLNGRITAADYARIDASFGNGVVDPSWLAGDFNHDGIVNYSDYAAMDAGLVSSEGYNALAQQEIAAHSAEFGSAYNSALATALAPVPEPASLGMLALGAAGLLARRRR